MKMRYILPTAMMAFVVLFTSCVKDLEVKNINPQQLSDFNEDYIFNKIYSNLVLTGQTGRESRPQQAALCAHHRRRTLLVE